MSVTATRKVSDSATATQKQRKVIAPGSVGGSFVEAVDTSNRVSIKARLERDKGEKGQKETPDSETGAEVLVDPTYVESALEALAASGVYEDMGKGMALMNINNIGIYSHNQFVISGEKIVKRQKDPEPEEDEYFFDDDYDFESDEEEEIAPQTPVDVDELI